MDQSNIILCSVLAFMVALFLTDLVSVDVTALLGLVVLALFGVIGVDQAFVGFSSGVVVAIVGTFFLAGALKFTGVADALATWVVRICGKSPPLIIAGVMAVAAFFSAFMNNVAATALLLPTAVSVGIKAKIPLSKLMMPLAFAAVFGGTLTLIGTPANILASDALASAGYSPFHFTDFTPVGLLIALLGIFVVAIIGLGLLPKGETPREKVDAASLLNIYKLLDRVFSLKIPSGSAIARKSLEQLDLGSILGVQVLSIEQDGRRTRAAVPESVVEEGDTLICRGKSLDVEAMLRFRAVKIIEADEGTREESIRNLSECWVEIASRDASTIREMQLRRKYGVIAAEISRDSERLNRDFGGESLSYGDKVRVVGLVDNIKALPNDTFKLGEIHNFNITDKTHACSILILPSLSPLVGMDLSDTRLDEVFGLLPLRIIRAGSLQHVGAEERLKAEDRIVVIGDPYQLQKVADLGKLQISDQKHFDLDDDGLVMVEATLAPRSRMIGKTLRDIKFRDRYGFDALAIWREKRPFRSRVPEIALKFGDGLLLRGPWSGLSLLAEDPDLVLLADSVGAPRRGNKAWIAILALITLVAFPFLGIGPVSLAAAVAAMIVVLGGAITMEEAYREVDWKSVVFIGALLPIGMVVNQSGGNQILTQYMASHFANQDPLVVLLALCVISSAMSQLLDGSVAVVFLAPIAIGISRELGLSPYPFMMGTALAASNAFLTPFSAKASMLVMGVGGYRAADYFKLGLLLTILMLILVVFAVPIFFPF